MGETFGGRLAAHFAAGRRLCVGIDPHASTLASWGLDDSATSAETMGREVVAAAAGHVACIKPQIAFFERFGAAGYHALERVFSDAREAGLTIIADVKRGDIGSTFAAYASAWLAPGSPLEADAMTVHAYHGIGSLAGAAELISQQGKGMFVLAATSNPEARPVQVARTEGGATLAQSMLTGARELSAEYDATADSVGSVGVVLGATVDLSDFDIDRSAQAHGPTVAVLAPGFGFQGAQVGQVRELFGSLADGVLVSESRSIVNGGAGELNDRIASSNALIMEAYA